MASFSQSPTSRTLSVGGSDISVILEFPTLLSDRNQSATILLGSLITISYSVYRDKRPVFNLGQPTIDGFAIGNKYVAGSMITSMYLRDEISMFLDENLHNSQNAEFSVQSTNIDPIDESIKNIHTVMRDDLTEFNIHIIFSSEYTGDQSRIILYGANFINNGQVMSIDDLITENTLSFIARDIREQHSIGDKFESIKTAKNIKTASSLLA